MTVDDDFDDSKVDDEGDDFDDSQVDDDDEGDDDDDGSCLNRAGVCVYLPDGSQ